MKYKIRFFGFSNKEEKQEGFKQNKSFYTMADMSKSNLIEDIIAECISLEISNRAAMISKIANKYYKNTAKEPKEFLLPCENLIKIEEIGTFSVATQWIKKRQALLTLDYFEVFEGWWNY